MRPRIWLALLTAAIGAATATAEDKTKREVLAAQDRRFAATVAGDVEALGRILGDEVTYTHSNGAVESRDQYLEAIRAGTYRYRSLTPEERRVRLLGDVAVVTGSCRVVVETGERTLEGRLRFTAVYARQGGEWRLVVWQSTRLP
jgi:ketosteroid isomerase-like protein